MAQPEAASVLAVRPPLLPRAHQPPPSSPSSPLPPSRDPPTLRTLTVAPQVLDAHAPPPTVTELRAGRPPSHPRGTSGRAGSCNRVCRSPRVRLVWQGEARRQKVWPVLTSCRQGGDLRNRNPSAQLYKNKRSYNPSAELMCCARAGSPVDQGARHTGIDMTLVRQLPEEVPAECKSLTSSSLAVRRITRVAPGSPPPTHLRPPAKPSRHAHPSPSRPKPAAADPRRSP